MPVIMIVYILFILVGGIFSIYHYRSRGGWFIVGEGFSLLFTLMIFLYYYKLYPKPDSMLVPATMFGYIFYWEFFENRELLIEEFQKENINKEDGLVMMVFLILMLSPLLYVFGNLIGGYLNI